jgi:hypothetical protein
MVLKTCKQQDCVKPWQRLHPSGEVASLRDALNPIYDDFYENQLPRVKYDHCADGFLLDAEGPIYQLDWSMFIPG